jgi:uncharacterized membrane protein YebE (DUF533 family)
VCKVPAADKTSTTSAGDKVKLAAAIAVPVITGLGALVGLGYKVWKWRKERQEKNRPPADGGGERQGSQHPSINLNITNVQNANHQQPANNP